MDKISFRWYFLWTISNTRSSQHFLNCNAILFFPVEEIEFIRELTDQKVTELPAKVTFECEISKPDLEGKWYKGREEIKAGRKYEISVDGGVHRLLVKDVCSEDDDEYSFVVKGKKTKAALLLEGN